MPVRSAVFPDRSTLLSAVRGVLDQYSGTAVTVRQLYYRLVAGGVIPNVIRSYKNLVAALSDWRRSGDIDFSAFEDRTRHMSHMDTGMRTDDPAAWARFFLQQGVENAKNYSLARWYGQQERVIVAVEKQALEGPFTEICRELDVDLVVARGYPSLSYLHEIAQAILDPRVNDGRDTVVLYFGDHDPSGQNIPEVIERDLGGLFSARFELIRVALNPDQVEEMELIPAPVKLTDSRANTFIAEHGEEVYELDAIEPNTLQQMIRDAVNEHFDDDIYEGMVDTVEKGKRKISRLLKKGGIEKLLKDLAEQARTQIRGSSDDEEGDEDQDEDDEEEAS